MKIMIIVPITTGVYKDDTTMFCEGLEKYCEHEIIRAEIWSNGGKIYCRKQINMKELIKGVEVIWAPYEPLIQVANFFGKEFNIPVVGHFEVMPPGKFMLEEKQNHWFKNVTPPTEHLEYDTYRHLVKEYEKCEIKTITGIGEKYKVEGLLGKKLKDEIYIKPYPVDNEMLEEYKIENVEEKDYILSISRTEYHKKLHHVIKALSLLENPPKLKIIGHGKAKDFLINLAKELKVDVEFISLISDKEKAKLIQECMFLAHGWACLPIGECSYYKKPSINYDDTMIRDRLNDMCYYVENNNIEELAKTIQMFIDKPELRKEYGEKFYKYLIDGKAETYLLKTACEKMSKMFELAKEKGAWPK